MKKIIFTIHAIFLISSMIQSQSLVWTSQLGGAYNDFGYCIALDASGNVYTTGIFVGTSDFDPGTGTYNLNSNEGRFFISKLDALGHFVWAKQLGGSTNTGLNPSKSIAVDGSGNIYITGAFGGTADFDPSAQTTFNLTSYGYEDIFISKIDASGNFVWAKQMGAAEYEKGSEIVIGASGDVYTVGNFQGTVDFDPGIGTFNLTATAGSQDIFICKLDAAGNFAWVKQLGGAVTDFGHSIAIDASDNIYITGTFVQTADFDPSVGTFNLTAAGSQDIFLSKLDIAGNFVWAKQLGGTSTETSTSLVVDINGYIYTTGYFEQTADFDPGTGKYNLTSGGYEDIFISKLDGLGNFVWAKQLGSTGMDISYSINIDALGNVYTAGSFIGTVDFDPGPGTFSITTNGQQDGFISKLDAAGNFVWTEQLGGIYNDQTYSIAFDASSNIYASGIFTETVDFDPGTGVSNLTSSGGFDVFIHKISNTITSLSKNSFGNNFNFSPNPTEGHLLVNLGKLYTQISLTIIDVNGHYISTNQYTSADKLQFDIKGNPGVYFLEIRTNDSQYAYLKVVKQ